MITPDKSMLAYADSTVLTYSYDQTNTVNYQFNKSGFRNHHECDFIPEYVFFGCSTVFGVGVASDKIFSSYFNNYFNFGLETDDSKKFNLPGPYNNLDILSTLIDFNNNLLYTNQTKCAVLWTDRDNEDVDLIIKDCNSISINLVHFKIGLHNSKLSQNLLPQVDSDASKTHGGIKSHKLWAYQIYKTLNQ